MASPKMTLTRALLAHLVALLTLRHNGQGLPSSPNGLYAILLVVLAIAQYFNYELGLVAPAVVPDYVRFALDMAVPLLWFTMASRIPSRTVPLMWIWLLACVSLSLLKLMVFFVYPEVPKELLAVVAELVFLVTIGLTVRRYLGSLPRKRK